MYRACKVHFFLLVLILSNTAIHCWSRNWSGQCLKQQPIVIVIGNE